MPGAVRAWAYCSACDFSAADSPPPPPMVLRRSVVGDCAAPRSSARRSLVLAPPAATLPGVPAVARSPRTPRPAAARIPRRGVRTGGTVPPERVALLRLEQAYETNGP